MTDASPILRRATALVLSWVLPATTVWSTTPLAVAPAYVQAPVTSDRTVEAAPKAIETTAAENAGSGDAQPNCADPNPPPADCSSFFGPRRYDRTTGPPNVYVTTVNVPASVTSPFWLIVQNGEADGSHRISSATIKVNGTQVAGPSDFNQNVAGFSRSVTLTPQTVLEVRLTSPPGSYLYISFCGLPAAPTDSTPPQLSVTQPAPGSTIGAATPHLRLHYVDLLGAGETGASGVDLATLVVTLDGIDRTSLFSRGAEDANADLPQALALAEGSHTVAATISDNAGNIGTATAAFSVDTQAPTLEVISPAEGSLLPSSPVTVSGTVDDADPGVAVECRANGSPAPASRNGASFECSLGLVSGANVITVTASDAVGHSTTVTRNVSLDSVAPLLAITSPSPEALVASPIHVTGTVSDDTAVDRVLVGDVPATVDGSGFSADVAALEGPFTLTARAWDTAGNMAQTAVEVVVASAGPALAIGSPAAGSYQRQSPILVSGTVESGDPQVSVRCQPGGVAASVAGGQWSCSVPLAEGPNAIDVTATDRLERQATASLAVTLDTQAPQVTIVQPGAGDYTSGVSLTVSGGVVDASPVTVEVEGTQATVSGASFTASDVPVGDGPLVTLHAVATDAAGNVGQAEVAVHVDRAPPLVAIGAPAHGAYVRGPSFEVSGTVADASPVMLDVNGTGAPVSGGAFSLSLAGSDGPLTITATAHDAAGNVGAASIEVHLDSAPPVVTVTSPLEGSITNQQPIPVAGTVNDASPVTLRLGEADVPLSGGAFALDAPPLPEGPATLTLTATDAAGNASTTTVSFTVDRTPPTLQVVSPTEGAVLTGLPVVVQGFVHDSAGASVSVDGIPAVRTGDAWHVSFAELPEGPRTFAVLATDGAGNVSAANVSIVLALVPPAVAIASPATGALTAEASIVVSGSVTSTSTFTVAVNGVPASVAGETFTATVPLVEGDNRLRAVATNAWGRTGEADVLVTRDSTPPVVGLIAPETLARGQTARVVASAADVVAVAQVVLSVNGTAVATFTAPPYEIDLVVPDGASSGDTLTVTAVATDTAGNAGSASRVVTVVAQGVVAGRVLSDETSLPLSGAVVTLVSRSLSTTTSDEGEYTLAVADAEVALRVSKDAMTWVERRVSVASGIGTVPVDARLTPLAAPRPIGPAGGTLDAGAWTITVPPGAVPEETPMSLTALSSQGLPGLLPLGWSPLAAAALETGVAVGVLEARVGGLPAGPLALAVYNSTLHDWTLVASDLVPDEEGGLSLTLPGAGRYAVLVADSPTGALVTGQPLPASPHAPLPETAASTASADPASLPPSGGTATATVQVNSPVPLPSGTVVAVRVRETFRLTAGGDTSVEERLEDIVLYRVGANEGAALAASFPVKPSRSFATSELAQGNVHLDILGGREGVRGEVGGRGALQVRDGDTWLSVPARSLDEDTLVSVDSVPLSAYLPRGTGLEPLQEALVDFSDQVLRLSAELSFAVGTATAGDTLLVARVAWIRDVPRLAVVSLARIQGDRIATVPGAGLPGIREGGRYVLYRLSEAVGFVSGTISTSAGPVAALVESDRLPFVSLSGADGAYVLVARPGSASISAQVVGAALAGTGSAEIVAGETTTLDIELSGAVSVATVTPANGAYGLERGTHVEITSPSALDPATVTAQGVRLLKEGSEAVAVRFVLSGSGRVLSVIPLSALDYSTSYRLMASGLVDVQGAAVQVPSVVFRIKDDVPPVYATNQFVFSMPQDGVTTVKAPCGTFPPGTRILIINSGNGAVLSLTAGNCGDVMAHQMPASIDDQLLVTITDPLGNVTTFTRSQFEELDAQGRPTGRTAIGPGGGVVRAIDGSGAELRIEEGTVDAGVVLKIESFRLEDLPEDERQLPDVPESTFSSGLRVVSEQMPTYRKEAKVAFPVPAGYDTSADCVSEGATRCAKDAFYFVYRRIDREGMETPGFEVIDNAFVEGAGENAKVVTASYPFPGYASSYGAWGMNAGLGLRPPNLMYLYDYFHPAALSRPPEQQGVVTGLVRQVRWDPGNPTPSYEPVVGAAVSAVDPSGVPLLARGGSSPTMATTDRNGRYVLWNRVFGEGNVRVAAVLRGAQAEPNCDVPHPSVRCATAFEAAHADWQHTPLHYYANIASANITFPPVEPPPAPPSIEIRVLRASDRQDIRGLVVAGTDLAIEFLSSSPVQGAEVRGESLSVEPDLTRGPTADVPPRRYYVLNEPYRPTEAGSHTVVATALVLPATLVSSSVTFLVVASPGQTNNTPQPGPPGVIRWEPRRGARGVAVTVFPQVVFTEPVRNVPGHVRLVERITDQPERDVRIGFLGAQVDGTPIRFRNEDGGPGPTVVSLTIEPLESLKFNARYELRLDSGIEDQDDEDLSPFETSFETFGPEGVGGTSTTYGSPGIVVLGDYAYLVHNVFWNGIVRAFDISDPVEPQEVESAQNWVQGRPVDVAGEGGTLVVATGPPGMSKPSNLYLFDVSDPSRTTWTGVASLTASAGEGTINRIAVKDGYAYAATYNQGIQVVELDGLRQLFHPCCGLDYWDMRVRANTDGVGWAYEAVVNTIDVRTSNNTPARLFDLKVDDSLPPMVFATGDIPLVIADPQGQELPRPLIKSVGADGAVLGELRWGAALALARVANESSERQLAAIAGQGTVAGTAGTVQVLATADVTDPSAVRTLFVVPLEGATSQPSDMVVKDGQLLISTHKEVLLYSLGSGDLTAPPRFTGKLTGVGGRLALTDSGLLLSTARSINGGDSNPLGGIRTAALGTTALVEGTDPGRVVVGEGPRAAEAFRLKFRVIPPTYEVQHARIEYRVGEQTVGPTMPVTLPDGRGSLPFDAGFTFPKHPTTGAIARPRLVINPGTPEQLVSGPKNWNTEKVVVRYRWDEDPQVATADMPEVEVEAASQEWFRRSLEATPEHPAVQRLIGWEAQSPPAQTMSANSLASDGVFETVLQTGTRAGDVRLVSARLGGVLLGTTEATTVEPGLAAVVTLTADKQSFPADGKTEVLLTLEAKDAFGNLVTDGTAVFWDTNGEGEFVETQETTTGGRAIARYRAGSYRPQAPTFQAHIDDRVAEILLRQEFLQMTVTPARDRVSYFDTSGLDLEVVATSAAGPPADGALLDWHSTTGKVVVTQPLTGGIGRARWVPVAGMPYRSLIAFAASIGSARGGARVTWVPGRIEALSGGNGDGKAEPQKVEVSDGRIEAGRSPGDPPIVTVDPMVIAGDSTTDGTFTLELPDGTTKDIPYKATAEYRVIGLVPGERVDVRLGSNKNPNVAPIAYYRAEQAIVEGAVADDVGRHEGTATGGVTMEENGYRGQALRFDGSGVIAVPHDEEFEFQGAFMVQTAVKPPPGQAQTLLEKANDYELALVMDGGTLKARFTVSTVSGPQSVTSVLPVADGVWSLITGRYESGTLSISIDSSEESMTLPEAPVHSAEPLRIGPSFVGALDDVRITDLTKPPLSTFANGAQELSFTADGSGEFVATIQSTGQLGPGVPLTGGHRANQRAGGPEDEGDASQEALSGYFTDTVTYFQDRGERTESSVGYVTNELLAYGFEFVAGIWGAGDGSMASIAGDIVGGTVLGIITTPRDFINAAERAVRLQGNKWDAVAIVTGLVGAATVVASKKARLLGKVKAVSRLVGRGEHSGPLARRIAKEVLNKLDEVPGARSLDNVARIAAEGSTEAKVALRSLMDSAGTRGVGLDLVEGVLAHTDDTEEMIRTMGRLQGRLPTEQLLDILTLAGSCALKAAAAARGVALTLALATNAAATPSCPRWTPKALEGFADYTVIVHAAQAARGKTAKGLTQQLMGHLTARGKVTETLEKVNHFATKDPRPDGFADVLLDLGRKTEGTSRGAERVLDMGYALVNPPVAGRSLRRFELPQDIPALRTARGNIRSRRYDIVLDEGGKAISVEVKAWGEFPPFRLGQLEGALDQMRRDFVFQLTSAEGDLSRIRWIFPDIPPNVRPQLMSYFRNSLEHNPAMRAALSAQGFSPTQISDFIDVYKDLVDRGRLIRFVP